MIKTIKDIAECIFIVFSLVWSELCEEFSELKNGTWDRYD